MAEVQQLQQLQQLQQGGSYSREAATAGKQLQQLQQGGSYSSHSSEAAMEQGLETAWFCSSV